MPYTVYSGVNYFRSQTPSAPMAAGHVVSFRPTKEERELIERVRRDRGFSTNAEAIRFLLRRGADVRRPPTDPLLGFKVPRRHRLKRSLTSEEIDAFLYGGSR